MTSAEAAAEVFQQHRDELGFVNRAQCEEGDLVTVERDGRTVGAALGNHCVRKPQTTLYDLAVLPEYRREGLATELVDRLASESPHEKIIAKCPDELAANDFYATTGWELINQEDGKNRLLNVWRYDIPESPDLIATGRPDLTAIAERHGYLRGSRLDDVRRYEREGVSLDFIDMDWHEPDPEELLAAIERHGPKYAIAGDYKRDGSNIDVINDRAATIEEMGSVPIVVPKSPGQVAEVPDCAFIGYSTPTGYEGTDILIFEYQQSDLPIHILGGSPSQQQRVLQYLGRQVRSIDGNYIHRSAIEYARYWQADEPHWPQVTDDIEPSDRAIEAYRRSVKNISEVMV